MNGVTLQNVLLLPATVGWGGVAILFKKSFEFKIHDEVKDTLGNYIILDISIQDYRMTLAAVYRPNEDKPCFFRNIAIKNKYFSQLLNHFSGRLECSSGL